MVFTRWIGITLISTRSFPRDTAIVWRNRAHQVSAAAIWYRVLQLPAVHVKSVQHTVYISSVRARTDSSLFRVAGQLVGEEIPAYRLLQDVDDASQPVVLPQKIGTDERRVPGRKTGIRLLGELRMYLRRMSVRKTSCCSYSLRKGWQAGSRSIAAWNAGRGAGTGSSGRLAIFEA